MLGRHPRGVRGARLLRRRASRRRRWTRRASVGSLHHFGGKSELYVALWQEYTMAQEEAASQAVAKARRCPASAVHHRRAPTSRAALGAPRPGDAVRIRRHAARFEMMRRHRGHESIARTTRCSACRTDWTGCTPPCSPRSWARGTREVALAKNRRQADTVIGAVVDARAVDGRAAVEAAGAAATRWRLASDPGQARNPWMCRYPVPAAGGTLADSLAAQRPEVSHLPPHVPGISPAIP